MYAFLTNRWARANIYVFFFGFLKCICCHCPHTLIHKSCRWEEVKHKLCKSIDKKMPEKCLFNKWNVNARRIKRGPSPKMSPFQMRTRWSNLHVAFCQHLHNCTQSRSRRSTEQTKAMIIFHWQNQSTRQFYNQNISGLIG